MKNLEKIRSKNYKELTEKDWKILKKYGIVNGFGPRQSPILRFILKKLTPSFDEFSADYHDFGFWKGGDIKKFNRINKIFLYFLIKDAKKQKGVLKIYYTIFAIIYYFGVKFFGKKYFNFH